MIKKSILIILLSLVSPSLVFACKCILEDTSLKDEIEESDIVILGQCISAELLKQNDPDSGLTYLINYTFHVQKSWKGKTKGQKVVVQTGVGFGDCGYPFRLGLSYLIYGHIDKGRAYTNICTRSRDAGFYPQRIIKEAQIEIDELDKIIKTDQ
jgi:hypothetical protein